MGELEKRNEKGYVAWIVREDGDVMLRILEEEEHEMKAREYVFD